MHLISAKHCPWDIRFGVSKGSLWRTCNAAVDDNLYNLDAFALNVLCIIQDTMLFSVDF